MTEEVIAWMSNYLLPSMRTYFLIYCPISERGQLIVVSEREPWWEIHAITIRVCIRNINTFTKQYCPVDVFWEYL